MKFARGLLVVSWIPVLALAIACGNASPSGLFTDGEATSLGQAGADPSKAGSTAAGAGSAGADSGSSMAGAPGAAGKPSTADGGMSAGGAPAAGASNMGGSGNSAGSAVGSGGTSAGSAGRSGGSGGASAGSGGASAGSGGTSAGSAGSSGMSGAAGSSAGSTGCPSGEPTPNTGCLVTTTDSCFYVGVACSCQATNQPAGPRRWQCYGTPDKCPAAPPSDGVTCKPNSGAECPYPGGNYCACVGNGNVNGVGFGTGNGNGNGVGIGNEATWACQPAAPTCPATKPFKGMQCTNVRSCAYPEDQCFCDGAIWGCESNN